MRAIQSARNIYSVHNTKCAQYTSARNTQVRAIHKCAQYTSTQYIKRAQYTKCAQYMMYKSAQYILQKPKVRAQYTRNKSRAQYKNKSRAQYTKKKKLLAQYKKQCMRSTAHCTRTTRHCARTCAIPNARRHIIHRTATPPRAAKAPTALLSATHAHARGPSENKRPQAVQAKRDVGGRLAWQYGREAAEATSFACRDDEGTEKKTSICLAVYARVSRCHVLLYSSLGTNTLTPCDFLTGICPRISLSHFRLEFF